jgi:hypothetical protein
VACSTKGPKFLMDRSDNLWKISHSRSVKIKSVSSPDGDNSLQLRKMMKRKISFDQGKGTNLKMFPVSRNNF